MTVPCNGCTLCCRHDAIRLLPGDDPERYQTEPHPYKTGARMLAHKANGDCIYLGPDGCTIHDSKPQQCREMDCRNIARTYSKTKLKDMNKMGITRYPMAIYNKGRQLIGR